VKSIKSDYGSQDERTARLGKFAAIINHLATKKSLFYDAAQDLAGVWRQLMTMMNHFRTDPEISIWIPNYDVSVPTGGNRSLEVF
jgi:hypothetical protein